MGVSELTTLYALNFPVDPTGIDLIQSAYAFAEKAHAGQKRASGEEYFLHVFQTAKQLALWKLDAATIAAGLLHDTIEDCGVEPQHISDLFGPEILFLVEGVTKLSNLRYKGQERSVESLRKMMLAISKDLRIIFIKLADRLHNMRTIEHKSPAKQKSVSLETVEVYAPLAVRLGMQSLAGELEDLAFPYMHPEAYDWMKKNLKETYEERSMYLSRVVPVLEQKFAEHHIAPTHIDNRAKRIASLYKKLLRYDMDVERVYDLVAVRIIVEKIEECYLVLGLLHQLWKPLPGRIKDYIALPKPNGYQSLHTTVFCIDNRPTEFQIRTLAMHEHNENGTAAHWFYESQKGRKSYNKRQSVGAESRDMSIVSQLQEWQNQFPGSQEFIDALKIDIFSDRIFVLTPTGEVIDLPAGSTPVDFAYRVHSEVGDTCVGAKVNNKIVPLEHALQSGDIVEILTQRNKKPSDTWIRFIKTRYAAKKIKSSLSKRIALPKKTEYKITCSDRVGLIKDISSVFSRNKISIRSMHSNEEKVPTFKLIADIQTREKAEQILLKLRKIDGVKEISFQLV